MQIQAKTVDEYVEKIEDPTKQEAITRLREVILKNIPAGFTETMSYGMIGYVVPHELYPAGYHCDPKLPLPFINIAAQKNFVAVYHMGIYADPDLLTWFTDEHAKRVSGKLDMGKSCIRYKHADKIPVDLIGELVSKMSPQDWVNKYESLYRPKK